MPEVMEADWRQAGARRQAPNRWLIQPGPSGVPSSRVNTRPESVHAGPRRRARRAAPCARPAARDSAVINGDLAVRFLALGRVQCPRPAPAGCPGGAGRGRDQTKRARPVLSAASRSRPPDETGAYSRSGLAPPASPGMLRTAARSRPSPAPEPRRSRATARPGLGPQQWADLRAPRLPPSFTAAAGLPAASAARVVEALCATACIRLIRDSDQRPGGCALAGRAPGARRGQPAEHLAAAGLPRAG